MSHQDLQAFDDGGLSGEALAILMAPGVLNKIEGILWPSAGPDLLELSGQSSLRPTIYEYTQYGRSCSYVWHPMSAIARLPKGSGQKAAIVTCLTAELDDLEASAVEAFMTRAPSMVHKIQARAAGAAADGYSWPEVWDTLAYDLWTFLVCGFQSSQVRNAATLDLTEQVEDEIMQLAFQCA
jgi:hypothetical protein